MSRIKVVACVLSLFAVTTFVWASESDELRERAKMMLREGAELAERGHHEEAANLKRKATAMLEEAKHLEQHAGLKERRPEISKLRLHLEKLRSEEARLKETGAIENREERLDDIRREAEAIEDKLRHMSREPHAHPDGPHDDIARRLEHMRIAVEHLNHAGLRDIAEHVVERAEATERELDERNRGRQGDVIHEVMAQLDEIRREMGRLRDEVNELKEKR